MHYDYANTISNRCASIPLCERLRFRFLFHFVVGAQSIIGALYLYITCIYACSVPICNMYCTRIHWYKYKYYIYYLFYPYNVHMHSERKRDCEQKEKLIIKSNQNNSFFTNRGFRHPLFLCFVFVFICRPCFCFETNICDAQHTYHTSYSR